MLRTDRKLERASAPEDGTIRKGLRLRKIERLVRSLGLLKTDGTGRCKPEGPEGRRVRTQDASDMPW